MTYLMATYQVSERRACRAAQFWRSSLRYTSVRDPLIALRQRMRELAETRVRFGYRRLLVLLRREGWEVGKERFYRVYIEEGLALRRKRPWRHATAVHREQRRPATDRNDIWSMDFVADELADRRSPGHGRRPSAQPELSGAVAEGHRFAVNWTPPIFWNGRVRCRRLFF